MNQYIYVLWIEDYCGIKLLGAYETMTKLNIAKRVWSKEYNNWELHFGQVCLYKEDK